MRKSLLFSVALGVIATTVSIAGERSPTVGVTPLLLDNVVQNIIKGKVTGTDGAISGATITVVGTSVSAASDVDGNFSIRAKVGDVIRVTYNSNVSKDVKVVTTNVHFSLLIDKVALGEVFERDFVIEITIKNL